MKTKITIICPQLLTLYEDRLGSGIPYMPVIAAYLAAVLKEKYSVAVIDAFGEDPFHAWVEGKYIIQGIPFKQVAARISPDTGYCILYVSTIMANYVLHKTIRIIKRKYPYIPVILVENSQGVIGCSLKYLARDFFASGADYIVLGECELKVPALLDDLQDISSPAALSIPGVLGKSPEDGYRDNKHFDIIEDLDSLPFPAWELFPIHNYWKLGYAHGPMQSEYLAVMTSRGCPFNCSFCVVPSMNRNKWRARSPRNVVKEFQYLKEEYGVSEFHLEDLNPTSDEKRMADICRLIMEKKLDIKWKLASGSKIETISLSTLGLMKQAGCDYISFSPESGSRKVLKLMKKPFNHEYALRMTKEMHRLGIKTQACFVLGFPGEDRRDRQLTQKYIFRLARAGIDEIALFILTPIPGTRTYDLFTGYSDYSELTFAPTWREDYEGLCRFRDAMYKKYLLLKIVFHPIKVIRQVFSLLGRRFQTKSEMNIYRLLVIRSILKSPGPEADR